MFAPAKINLALHVVGRRADGYHELDSLVVFADIGDTVEALPGDGGEALEIAGPFASGLTSGEDNLVLAAKREFAERQPLPPLRLRLVKRLPVASGIGGGSADAAAALRLLAGLSGREIALDRIAGRLGADVPMCLASRPLRARGVGERIEPWDDAPKLHLVLVNPGVAVSTPAVFRRLERRDNPPIGTLPARPDAGSLADWLEAETRNDLEGAAMAEAPVIASARAALLEAGCRMARMSGSGATVFGLFADAASASAAADGIAARNTGWWVRAAGTITSLEG